jgi:hypothetical protein
MALALALASPPGVAAAERKPRPAPPARAVPEQRPSPKVLDLSMAPLAADVTGILDRPPIADERAETVLEEGEDRASALRRGQARLDATIRPTHRRFTHDVVDPNQRDRPDSIGLRLRVPLGEPQPEPPR